MEIVHADPPMMDQIDKKFKVKGQSVIFAWDGKIYNPKKLDIPVYLIAHEKVHSDRQNGNPEGWWTRYLEDDEFRFLEELEAHLKEYFVFQSIFTDRNFRIRQKHSIAVRMSSPLYGSICTYRDVMSLLNAL